MMNKKVIQLIFEKDNLKLFLNYLVVIYAVTFAFGHQLSGYIIRPIILLWLLTVDYKKVFNLFKDSIFFKVILVYSSLVILMYFNTEYSMEEYEKYIRRYFLNFFVPFIIILTSIQKEFISKIIGAFLGGMFINEIISYGIYFDIWDTTYSLKYQHPVGFIHHVPYSALVAFTAIFLIYEIKNTTKKWQQYMYTIFFITMTINLVISSGRTGYIAFFATLPIIVATYYKLNLKNIIQIIIAPMIVFAIGYYLNQDVQKRVESAINATKTAVSDQQFNSSFGVRLAAYPIAWQWIKNGDNLLFGESRGDIHTVRKELIEQLGKKENYKLMYNASHFHNDYIEILISLGFIGLFLFLYILYYIYTRPIKDHQIRFLQKLFIPIMFISGFADLVMFHIRETMMFFAMCSALILWQYNFEKENKVISQ